MKASLRSAFLLAFACAVLLSCSTYKGYSLLRDQKPQEALPVIEKALADHEKSYGPDNTLVGLDALMLGETYRRLGEYAKSRDAFNKSLAIFEKKEGAKSRNALFVRYALAELTYHEGQAAKAAGEFKALLPVSESLDGPEGDMTAKIMANLSVAYNDLGRYEEARTPGERAVAILTKKEGADGENTASAKSNLALTCVYLGDLAKAKDLLESARLSQEKRWGKESANAAVVYANLGMLYNELKDYAQAEDYSARALRGLEKNLPADHPLIISVRNNLSSIYQSTGRSKEAQALGASVVEATRKKLGAKHPDMAHRLNNAAIDLAVAGELDKAQEGMREAVAIMEETMGPEHPVLAKILNNQAGLLYLAGRPDEAGKILPRAKAIAQKTVGEKSESFSDVCYIEGLVLASKGANAKAMEAFLKGQEADDALIGHVMGFAADQNKLTYLTGNRFRVDAAFSLALTRLGQDQAAGKAAMDLWLKRKGAVLEAQKQFQEAILVDAPPAVQKDFDELTRTRAALARLALSSGEAGPGAAKELAALEARKAALEAKLAGESKTFAKSRRSGQASSSSLAAALPAGSALVELCLYTPYDFAKRQNADKRYLAFVLPAGQGGAPTLVDLGAAAPIDEAAAGFVKAMRDTASDGNPREAEAARWSARLGELVFAPLVKPLGKARRVYVSPDGSLNLFPFEVLTRLGRPLIEEYTFTYLSAGRDLAGFEAGGFAAGAGGGKPALFGDPDFNLGEKEAQAQAKAMGVSVSRGGDVSMQLRGQSYRRLPGTASEVKAISAALPGSSVYLGPQALEGALYTLKGPRVLHLATHGFFLPGGQAGGDARTAVLPIRSAGQAQENPLLRSGIVLAGANTSLRQGGGEGVVTAEELLNLNLRGTELVVLSACETGLGDVMAGEGVFGLRRSLMQAGAQGLVMSLWSVPDKETGELMAAFYKNLLAGGMDRPAALRQAIMDTRKLSKERNGVDNPYFWGAFVYMGEP
jgi:tetratricopeptide (TPR) repeat protein